MGRLLVVCCCAAAAAVADEAHDAVDAEFSAAADRHLDFGWETVRFVADEVPADPPDAAEARERFAALEDPELRRRHLAALEKLERRIAEIWARRERVLGLRKVPRLSGRRTRGTKVFAHGTVGGNLPGFFAGFELDYELTVDPAVADRPLTGRFARGKLHEVLEAMAAAADAEVVYDYGRIVVRDATRSGDAEQGGG